MTREQAMNWIFAIDNFLEAYTLPNGEIKNFHTPLSDEKISQIRYYQKERERFMKIAETEAEK